MTDALHGGTTLYLGWLNKMDKLAINSSSKQVPFVVYSFAHHKIRNNHHAILYFLYNSRFKRVMHVSNFCTVVSSFFIRFLLNEEV